MAGVGTDARLWADLRVRVVVVMIAVAVKVASDGLELDGRAQADLAALLGRHDRVRCRTAASDEGEHESTNLLVGLLGTNVVRLLSLLTGVAKLV